MIRLLIIDDHQSFAQGLRMFLESVESFTITGLATNGRIALTMLPDLDVDVVILDLDMPSMNGEETLKIIKKDYPHIKVLILTSFSDTCVIDTMKKLGAEGYRNKEAGMEDIMRAIINIHQGYLDYLVKENSMNPLVSINFNTFRFTKQEHRVVKYLSEGMSGKEIAALMNLSEHTIDSHCRTARAKANAKNSAELVAMAIKHGLI